jgi:chromosome partitioning protein
MRSIMVLNAKGGCGKSTLATNLASYYATEKGSKVALADYDPQQSSLDWLARRPERVAPIAAVPAFKSGLRGVPRDTEVLIIDAPARSHGKELETLVKHAETIIVPVLPSSIDMLAANRFLEELRPLAQKKAKIAVVANRVRENTLIFETLDEYLSEMRVPYVATLRDAQNYVRAYTRGLGIYELPEYLAWPDWEQWHELVSYLNSKRSRIS